MAAYRGVWVKLAEKIFSAVSVSLIGISGESHA